ncbi:MAG TPA: 7-carboxy-7-deazaguanine synthase QueE [Gammaproteobacteria bacterium]|jgi:7-carboxy-7-deazaguanine synthase|nr:MAG: 7-carboxy-7-deazaguanine synthase QueE [OM182 bacterium]HAL41412.1 7-carboxy-7-deazaguanine synthase QueE [Gammaproteobacteria bacterium]HBK18549.1 7-carboxy-7-deazaguanine synthase QueE [Gammaproteobacteria bacterium]|tara:strand:+ start:45018 stop:45662 length:645 start_codon:yes stop_codon:yes gene_type:complete
MTELRITEIFLSLQGEASSVGRPTVFVRLTGCPLRCQYCDSAYAFSGGDLWTLDKIVEAVAAYGVPLVTVTGGEPLAQPGVTQLMQTLLDKGFEVSLETSGALSIEAVPTGVSCVVDLKTPGSAEAHRNHWPNMGLLKPIDQVKFVVCDRADYDWARMRCDEYDLYHKVAEVLFSPSYEQLMPKDLADWIVADRLPARMQLQMHKLLWGDVPGR